MYHTAAIDVDRASQKNIIIKTTTILRGVSTRMSTVVSCVRHYKLNRIQRTYNEVFESRA